tara:strand:- start:723 stop:893 length:171 start_codon:yes stop_codon:yes gene_type:complete
MMTEDQFVELVGEMIKFSISTDDEFIDDLDYEIRNVAINLSKRLRVEGFLVPEVGR